MNFLLEIKVHYFTKYKVHCQDASELEAAVLDMEELHDEITDKMAKT